MPFGYGGAIRLFFWLSVDSEIGGGGVTAVPYPWTFAASWDAALRMLRVIALLLLLSAIKIKVIFFMNLKIKNLH